MDQKIKNHTKSAVGEKEFYMKQSWVSTYGLIDYTNNEITLLPIPQQSLAPESTPSAPYAYVRSNVEFEQGTIRLEVKFSDPDSKCQIGLNSGQGTEVYAGLNVLGALYGFTLSRNNQWEPLGGSGFGSHLSIEQWHEIKLHVQGSNLDLYFNGVKVVSVSQRIQKGPINLLLQGLKPVIVRNIRIEQKSPICFIVMQFTDEYNALYHDVIRPTCESFGYMVVRADDFYTSGLIIDDITKSIQEATIVIADVTPNNPNVFYEVGYAHGINKPTILLSDRKRDKLPFDISGFRTLFYDNTIGGKSAVEERLKKHLENIGV